MARIAASSVLDTCQPKLVSNSRKFATMRKINFALAFGTVLVATKAAFGQCVLPNQLTNGQVADATQVMANFNALGNCVTNIAPGGQQNSIQFNNGTGGFGGVTPLTDGQVLIGSSGHPPQAGAITAGPGIAILNGPGSITIATTGSGSGGDVDWLNYSAVAKPIAANFALTTSTTAPVGAAITATSRGMALTASTVANNRAMMAEVDAPSGNWQATMLTVYSGPLSTYNLPGIAVRDVANSRTITFGISANGNSAYRFDYLKMSGGTGFDSYSNDSAFSDTGLPAPSSPTWSRLTYNGSNFVWSFSRDGQNFSDAYSVSATDHITNRNKVGPAIVFFSQTNPGWSAAYHVLSWKVAPL